MSNALNVLPFVVIVDVSITVVENPVYVPVAEKVKFPLNCMLVALTTELLPVKFTFLKLLRPLRVTVLEPPVMLILGLFAEVAPPVEPWAKVAVLTMLLVNNGVPVQV